MKSTKSTKNYLLFYFLLLAISSISLFTLFSNTGVNSKLAHSEKLKIVKQEEAKIMNALQGTNMTSFSIEAGEYNDTSFRFGCESNFFAFSTRGKTKDFIISNMQQPLLSISKDNDMMLFSKTLVAEEGLTFTGDFKVRGVLQWKLVYEEFFESEETTKGWTSNSITECGGVSMLGGYGKLSKKKVTKIFDNLPKHSNIRIQATYHFIDAWDGENGYMRLDNGRNRVMQYAWIQRYSAFSANQGINVCGGHWPEGKFSSPIDLTIPHKDTSINVEFGATLDQDAYDQSFGISGVRIYIK